MKNFCLNNDQMLKLTVDETGCEQNEVFWQK